MSETNSTKPIIDATRKKAYEGPSMLPGMAMISMFMLMIAMIAAFASLTGKIDPHMKYTVLPIATLLCIGIFGFLRLKRWGWAIVLGGTVIFTIGYFLMWRQSHAIQPIVMSGFSLVFFLYLIREEVRIRLR